MDFITYLKRVINDFKSLGDKKAEAPEDAKKELYDYIDGYKKDAPENTYQRPESNSMTDSEIKEAAKAEYDAWLEIQTGKLSGDYDAKASKEELKKTDLLDSFSQTEAEIEKQFAAAKQKNHNSAVKQGVARSSIAQNQAAAIEDAKTDSAEQARQKYSSELARLDQSLIALEDKRRVALDELDYEYARLIDQRVKKLKSERQAREDELVKYNNELRQIEKEEQKPQIDYKKSEDIYIKAEELLSKMSAKEAREFIKSSKLKNALEPYHYYKLVKKYE